MGESVRSWAVASECSRAHRLFTSGASIHTRNHPCYAPVSSRPSARSYDNAQFAQTIRNRDLLLGRWRSRAARSVRRAARRRRRSSGPPTFIALGLGAAYLTGDVIGGYRARAAKLRAAKIRPLAAAAAPAYMPISPSELRRQTAGIGIDVVRLPNGLLVRIPAALTFDPAARRSSRSSTPPCSKSRGR